jgi:hypothetical protein
VAGRAWSLWAKRGVAEPGALVDGGVDLGGRWYGMCAGFPNVLETEFIDAGPHGIAYGYMAMPGRLTLLMAPSGLQSPTIVRLSRASFFIGTLAKSACDYPSVVLQATTPSGSAIHVLGFGRCQLGQVVAITSSSGQWSPGHGPAPVVPPSPTPAVHAVTSPMPTSTSSG